MKANGRICCPLSYVFLSNTCLRRLTGIVILNEVKNLNRFIGYKRRDPSAEFILSLGEGPKDDIATTVFRVEGTMRDFERSRMAQTKLRQVDSEGVSVYVDLINTNEGATIT